MDRRAFLAGAGGALFASPLAARAQQPGKVPRIGLLSAGSASGSANDVEALRAGLRDLGYVEGKNIAIESRWAEGKFDRLPDLAAELIRLKPDVLLTPGTPATLAAKRATTTIPIVMVNTGDAVATGLVASLARPGGNITGFTILSPELTAKRLEILKEGFPRTRQIAVLLNPDNPAQKMSFQAMDATAKQLKIGLQRLDVRGAGEFESTFSAMEKQHADAVVVSVDALFYLHGQAIAELAAKQRLPSAGPKEFAEAGGLIGYGANRSVGWRRAAYFVDRILKGAKPADLPVEQPTKFELVINLKTGKALGLTLPSAILVRADQVIQ
jgi:putative tryptophan/tyrosine transport system substrate-binding protein